MKNKCEECNGDLIQNDSVYVCNNCGLIANKIIEQKSIVYSKEEEMTNGQYVALSEHPSRLKSLGSFMGSYGKRYLHDSRGMNLVSEKNNKFRRLKVINDVYLPFREEQRLYRSFKILSEYSAALQLTETTKSDSLYLLKRCGINDTKHQRITPIVLACIYLVIRNRKENIELSKIVKIARSKGDNIKGKDIIRIASRIRSLSKLKITPVKPESYVENILSKLRNDIETVKLLNHKINDLERYFRAIRLVSRRILLEFPNHLRGGRNPFVFACAVVVASDNLLARKVFFTDCYKNKTRRGSITQKRISEIMNIAEFTLREHYLMLVKPKMEKIEKNPNPLEIF